MIVPPLGPFEETEASVQPETIRRNETTRLANRYFRNMWFRYDENEFELLREILASSWPEITLQRPESARGQNGTVIQMFYTEGRFDRELFWSGYGFQVWLQMLTHILRADEESILVIDEPDIYLHPDLQRKLLHLVRHRCAQTFMATHSIEIVNEADSGDVVSINSGFRSGKRVSTDNEYQALFNYIGSVENVDFSRLAKAKRAIFFEGKDKKLLRKFAKKLGGDHFVNDVDTAIFQTGGFTQWKRLKEVAWTFREVLKLEISLFALFDRDYRPTAEVTKFLENMQDEKIACFVFERKELENYVLSMPALLRAIQKRAQFVGASPVPELEKTIIGISDRFRHEVFGQIVANELRYARETGSHLDPSTISRNASANFENAWAQIPERFRLMPGKEFVSALSAYFQENHKFSISINVLIDQLDTQEIPADFKRIMVALEEFSSAK